MQPATLRAILFGLSASLFAACAPSSEDPDDPIVEPVYPRDGFCSEGGIEWAFCEDFDGRGEGGPAPLDLANPSVHVFQRSHQLITGVSCEVSQDCEPYYRGGTQLTIAEDSGFGWSGVRLQQPFDFAGREGHLRFTTNFNFWSRKNLGIVLTPVATTSMPDNRRFTDDDHDGATMGAVNGYPALAIKSFRTQDQGGRAVADAQVWNGGEEIEYLPVIGQHVIGHDTSILHDIDFYVSRTHVRMLIDGHTILDTDTVDLGFDRAYVYLTGLSYNAMKEDGIPQTRESNTELWDNIAFDGPSLLRNSLTPDGYQDVAFRAYAALGCTVRGVAAQGPIRDFYKTTWITWTARLPLDAGPITAGDIACDLRQDWPRNAGPQWGDLSIITR